MRTIQCVRKFPLKLFSMTSSTAASERNFSTMEFIHSDLRNILAPDTVKKLLYIKSNLGAFYESPKADSEKYGRNSEGDIDDNEPA